MSNMNYKREEDMKRLSFILDQVKNHGNGAMRILDVGCGVGNITMALASKGHAVTGIDISADSIAYARKNHSLPNTKYLVSKAEELEGNEVYDVIVCSEVIEHLPDPEPTVRALSRLLKKGGLMVVTVPNGFGPREVLMTKPMQAMNRRKGITWKMVQGLKRSLGYRGTDQSLNEDLSHLHFFSSGNLRKMFESQGLRNLTFRAADFIEGVFPFSYFTNRSQKLQKIDCWVADKLPVQLSSGFYTSWTK